MPCTACRTPRAGRGPQQHWLASQFHPHRKDTVLERKRGLRAAKRTKGRQKAAAPYPILATSRCTYGRKKPGPAPITPSPIRAGAVAPGPDIPESPPTPHRPSAAAHRKTPPKIQIDSNFGPAKRRRPPARPALVVRPNPPAQPRPPLYAPPLALRVTLPNRRVFFGAASPSPTRRPRGRAAYRRSSFRSAASGATPAARAAAPASPTRLRLQ